jgi:hypothetical protein
MSQQPQWGLWDVTSVRRSKGTDLEGNPSLVSFFANASHVNSLVREIRLLSVGHVDARLQVIEVDRVCRTSGFLFGLFLLMLIQSLFPFLP